MLKEIKADMKSDKKYYRDKRAYYKKHKEEIRRVANELSLPENTPVTANCDSYNVSIRVAGGPNELKEIFRAFRKLGYEPSDRPGIQPEASFGTYFRKDPSDDTPEFYLSFSSTICKRVKVGTKMVEQAIYETVCE